MVAPAFRRPTRRRTVNTVETRESVMGSKEKGGREIRKPKKDAKVKGATANSGVVSAQVQAKDRPAK
jgi:hypothetical protein